MKIEIRLFLADFFHGHVWTWGFILGLLAVCFLFAAGR